jgi:hypothetical protein
VNSGRTRADYINVNAGGTWGKGQGQILALLKKIEPTWKQMSNVTDFGFSLDPGEQRHLDIGTLPLPPRFNPPLKSEGPTREEFISGDVTTIIFALGTYKDVFDKLHVVVDCGAHTLGRPDFISCYAGNRHY